MLLMVEGKKRAAENAFREAMTIAWNGAALQRSKKMPRLEDVLNTKKRTRKRGAVSADRLLTMARMWTAAVSEKGE